MADLLSSTTTPETPFTSGLTTDDPNCIGSECLQAGADILDCAAVPATEQQKCVEQMAHGGAARALTSAGLRTEEQAKAGLGMLFRPWLSAWNPDGGRFQKVTGIDGEEYLVGRIGSRLWAIKLSFLISASVSISLLTFIFGAGILYWLYRTKEGKKVRTRVFGRKRRRRRS